MKTYVYSIFVRFYLAFTGLVVFLLTAYLFGADGRGVIGYGTSLFGVLGIICSLNFGRSYIALTKQSEDLKRRFLPRFLKLNLGAAALTAVLGVAFWWLSAAAKTMLTFTQVLLFSLMSLFYVWTINGNTFFAAFIATKHQEDIILIVRTALLFFLGVLFFYKSESLDFFIGGYAFLLFLGPLIEIFYLYRVWGKTPSGDGLPIEGDSAHDRAAESVALPNSQTPASLVNLVKGTFYHHLDFLGLNVFPLASTIWLASFISKADVGRYNFALQLVNLIWLFWVTANIRLTTYVADVGIRARWSQFQKLLWATLAASVVGVALLYFGVDIATRFGELQQFEGIAPVFLLCSLSVVGFGLYQFFSPVWLELGKQREAAVLHVSNLLVFVSICPFVYGHFGLVGAAWVFGLFHFGVAAVDLFLYCKYLRTGREVVT